MYNSTPSCKVPWQAPPSRRVALLDADGPLYSSARNGVTLCDGQQMQMLDDEEIYLDSLSRINEWESWCGDVAEVFVCLTSRTNFRKSLLETYKGNRPDDERPITLDALRGRWLEQTAYPVKLVEGLEADDVCGIAATSFQELGYETVIVSPDKDLLQIPGMVLTPKPARKGKRLEVLFSEVTEPRALYWHAYQTLVGDDTDNYKGCRGIGPAKAEKLLEACELDWSEGTVWEAVISAFQAAGHTKEYALVQARVARMLRMENWDQQKKEVIQWNFPN